MVDLMLETGGEETRGVGLADLVLAVEIAQPDLGRAGHVGIMLGQRQAALAAGRQLRRAPQNLGVGERHRLRLFAVARDIEHDDPAGDADLRRGEPDADRAVHRFEHVVHQPADLVVDRGDGRALILSRGSGAVMIVNWAIGR